MKIIISPAKKMVVDSDSFPVRNQPHFLAETAQIARQLQAMTFSQLKDLWRTNDALTQQNVDRLKHLDLTAQQTPAIIAYSGLQYQYMAPDVFTAPALDYVQANLRILSGFYGVLRPFDGVVPYRLEMQAKLAVGGAKNLYAFWGDKLYQAVSGEPIINLASEEYAKTVRRYLRPDEPFIDVVFAREINGQLKTRATHAKMARGALVRYMAEHQVDNVAALQDFAELNFQFAPEHSTDRRLVFIEP
ncbi:peroxide stress protein YaaA [Lacticaseibacillus brantae]|uniref:UPF0246 protein FC34_GL001018 n=1 Tax=Lacticaseibacillus brantae DSM 23927 TaxID=1423727 RepID=A0A0R2B8Y5_9LACO|nr:peroxide stress protein YaaA [Lacticaseibacillus brantae]KRM72035.1 hypothetical protein FC34_GL001018 [Lacticaseibacillus brantae DSM 23927]